MEELVDGFARSLIVRPRRVPFKFIETIVLYLEGSTHLFLDQKRLTVVLVFGDHEYALAELLQEVTIQRLCQLFYVSSVTDLHEQVDHGHIDKHLLYQ